MSDITDRKRSTNTPRTRAGNIFPLEKAFRLWRGRTNHLRLSKHLVRCASRHQARIPRRRLWPYTGSYLPDHHTSGNNPYFNGQEYSAFRRWKIRYESIHAQKDNNTISVELWRSSRLRAVFQIWQYRLFQIQRDKKDNTTTLGCNLHSLRRAFSRWHRRLVMLLNGKRSGESGARFWMRKVLGLYLRVWIFRLPQLYLDRLNGDDGVRPPSSSTFRTLAFRSPVAVFPRSFARLQQPLDSTPTTSTPAVTTITQFDKGINTDTASLSTGFPGREICFVLKSGGRPLTSSSIWLRKLFNRWRLRCSRLRTLGDDGKRLNYAVYVRSLSQCMASWKRVHRRYTKINKTADRLIHRRRVARLWCTWCRWQFAVERVKLLSSRHAGGGDGERMLRDRTVEVRRIAHILKHTAGSSSSVHSLYGDDDESCYKTAAFDIWAKILRQRQQGRKFMLTMKKVLVTQLVAYRWMQWLMVVCTDIVSTRVQKLWRGYYARSRPSICRKVVHHLLWMEPFHKRCRVFNRRWTLRRTLHRLSAGILLFSGEESAEACRAQQRHTVARLYKAARYRIYRKLCNHRGCALERLKLLRLGVTSLYRHSRRQRQQRLQLASIRCSRASALKRRVFSFWRSRSSVMQMTHKLAGAAVEKRERQQVRIVIMGWKRYTTGCRSSRELLIDAAVSNETRNKKIAMSQLKYMGQLSRHKNLVAGESNGRRLLLRRAARILRSWQLWQTYTYLQMRRIRLHALYSALMRIRRHAVVERGFRNQLNRRNRDDSVRLLQRWQMQSLMQTARRRLAASFLLFKHVRHAVHTWCCWLIRKQDASVSLGKAIRAYRLLRWKRGFLTLLANARNRRLAREKKVLSSSFKKQRRLFKVMYVLWLTARSRIRKRNENRQKLRLLSNNNNSLRLLSNSSNSRPRRQETQTNTNGVSSSFFSGGGHTSPTVVLSRRRWGRGMVMPVSAAATASRGLRRDHDDADTNDGEDDDSERSPLEEVGDDDRYYDSDEDDAKKFMRTRTRTSSSWASTIMRSVGSGAGSKSIHGTYQSSRRNNRDDANIRTTTRGGERVKMMLSLDIHGGDTTPTAATAYANIDGNSHQKSRLVKRILAGGHESRCRHGLAITATRYLLRQWSLWSNSHAKRRNKGQREIALSQTSSLHATVQRLLLYCIRRKQWLTRVKHILFSHQTELQRRVVATLGFNVHLRRIRVRLVCVRRLKKELRLFIKLLRRLAAYKRHSVGRVIAANEMHRWRGRRAFHRWFTTTRSIRRQRRVYSETAICTGRDRVRYALHIWHYIASKKRALLRCVKRFTVGPVMKMWLSTAIWRLRGRAITREIRIKSIVAMFRRILFAWRVFATYEGSLRAASMTVSKVPRRWIRSWAFSAWKRSYYDARVAAKEASLLVWKRRLILKSTITAWSHLLKGQNHFTRHTLAVYLSRVQSLIAAHRRQHRYNETGLRSFFRINSSAALCMLIRNITKNKYSNSMLDASHTAHQHIRSRLALLKWFRQTRCTVEIRRKLAPVLGLDDFDSYHGPTKEGVPLFMWRMRMRPSSSSTTISNSGNGGTATSATAAAVAAAVSPVAVSSYRGRLYRSPWYFRHNPSILKELRNGPPTASRSQALELEDMHAMRSNKWKALLHWQLWASKKHRSRIRNTILVRFNGWKHYVRSLLFKRDAFVGRMVPLLRCNLMQWVWQSLVEYARDRRIEREIRSFVDISKRNMVFQFWRREVTKRNKHRRMVHLLERWTHEKLLRFALKRWWVSVGPGPYVANVAVSRFAMQRWFGLTIANRKWKRSLLLRALTAWRRLLWLRNITNTSLRRSRGAYVLLATRLYHVQLRILGRAVSRWMEMAGKHPRGVITANYYIDEEVGGEGEGEGLCDRSHCFGSPEKSLAHRHRDYLSFVKSLRRQDSVDGALSDSAVDSSSSSFSPLARKVQRMMGRSEVCAGASTHTQSTNHRSTHSDAYTARAATSQSSPSPDHRPRAKSFDDAVTASTAAVMIPDEDEGSAPRGTDQYMPLPPAGAMKNKAISGHMMAASISGGGINIISGGGINTSSTLLGTETDTVNNPYQRTSLLSKLWATAEAEGEENNNSSAFSAMPLSPLMAPVLYATTHTLDITSDAPSSTQQQQQHNLADTWRDPATHSHSGVVNATTSHATYAAIRTQYQGPDKSVAPSVSSLDRWKRELSFARLSSPAP